MKQPFGDFPYLQILYSIFIWTNKKIEIHNTTKSLANWMELEAMMDFQVRIHGLIFQVSNDENPPGWHSIFYPAW